MVEHFIDEFIGSVIGQCLDQIAVSHISGSQTIAVCFHIFYQVLKYFALQMTIRFITSRMASTKAGKLHASDRLPGDRTLAELLGVSRSAVREALKVLSAIGVVNILPGSGVYLAKNTRDIFTLPFSWTTLLSADSNNNIYELRVLIERETVRLATEQHREQVTNFLRPLIEYEGAMLEAENYAEIHKCDTNFHMGIATCAGNELLTDLLFICRKILSFLNALGTSTPNKILELPAEHSRVFYAIEQGDSEAAQKLIVDHLKRAEQRYMGLH